MCKYCNRKNHSYLINKTFGKREDGFTMSLIVNIFENILEADYSEYNVSFHGDSNFHQEIEINYCPVCGEKLQKTED